MSSRLHGKCVLAKDERRSIHSLLRLDSTGEVSSDSYINSHQQSSNMCYGNMNCKRCSNNRAGIGQKMNSMIDRASAYWGSASSYIGGFCPYKRNKAAQGFVKTNSHPISDPVLELENICDQSLSNMTIGNKLEQCGDKPPTKIETNPKAAAPAWPVLGVLQSNFVKPNISPVGSMAKVEPYRPPHLKGKVGHQPSVSAACKLNPKLTPYNARLLANSRKTHQQSGCEAKTVNSVHLDKTSVCDVTHGKEKVLNSNSQMHNPSSVFNLKGKQETAHVDNSKETSTACDKDIKMADGNTLADPIQATSVPVDQPSKEESSKSSIKSSQCNAENLTSDSQEVEPKQDTTDWFEYENTACDIIPIKLPRELNNNVNINKDIDQSQGKSSSLLHNWFSVDNDVDVKKTDQQLCHESSPNEVITRTELAKIPVTNTKQDIPPSEVQQKSVDENGKTADPTSVIPSEKDLLSVLYIRRNCQFSKKGRPSSKKRRRQRSQQNDSSESADVEEKNAKNTEQAATSNTKSNSSISFILGLDASNVGNGSSHSFLMTCDVDSDIDWSDSDLEMDGGCDSDGASCENFDQFQNCLGLVNFQVSCSMQSPAEINETPSEIEAVNIAWNIHIRQVEHSPGHKNKSALKKVHFPEEEKELAKVHPETEWCEEYQAARKGPWEEYARDRERFKRRISECEAELRPFLTQQHRDQVFQHRFNEITD